MDDASNDGIIYGGMSLLLHIRGRVKVLLGSVLSHGLFFKCPLLWLSPLSRSSPIPSRPHASHHIQDVAAYIKKEFDKKYNPTWHCIVGRNFGSYVTHETKHFIYFYLGQVAILLFKSG